MPDAKLFPIRPAIPADFEAIYAIWLAGIAHSFAGFAHPPDLREQFHHNFTTCQPPFSFWVAEDAKDILGWQSLLPCTSNPLKRHLLAESSTYVASGIQNNGLGESLLRWALTEAEVRDLQFVLGWILAGNERMRALVRRCHFEPSGGTFTAQVPPLTSAKELWVYTVPANQSVTILT